MTVTLDIIDGPNYERDADGWQHQAYVVRLSYEGRSLETPWRAGLGITEDPTAADVLGSLLMDASSYENARGFEDWAGDYGYDTDSRNAEETYNAVGEATEALRQLLGDDYETAIDPPDLADYEDVAKRMAREAVA
jgi:hypothetical protein